MKRQIQVTIAFAVAAVMALLIGGSEVPARQPVKIEEIHFRCYIVSQQTPQPAVTITLDDQFTDGPATTIVGEPVMFCVPTAKTVGEQVFPIPEEPEEQPHYTLYNAQGVAAPRTILVTDQFGEAAEWQVTTPKYVLVPSTKTIGGVTFGGDVLDELNHYWCYQANGPRVGVQATLEDQFSGPDEVRVTTPTLFCNPAEKVSPEGQFRIEDRQLHLACYEVHGKQATEQFTFTVHNQFETDEYQSAAWEIICAPAAKEIPSASNLTAPQTILAWMTAAPPFRDPAGLRD
jgi:hypothetical protein